MKNGFSLLIFLLTMSNAFAQPEPANYHMAVARFTKFYNLGQSDSIFTMSTPKVQAILTGDKMVQMVKQLNTQLGTLNTYDFIKIEGGHGVYKAVFANTKMNMTIAVTDDGLIDGLRFLPSQPESGTTLSNLVLKTQTGNIYGTLTVPETNKKVPVVLIIAGSGPTDRNCNSSLGLTCNAYLMLADSLQRRGIACARYDKRGVGESVGALKSEESLSFNDMVDDAAGFIRILRADTRFSQVIVLGHSEGSLIGMLAAQHEPVDKFISLAGAGRPADRIIEEQLAVSSAAISHKATTIMDSLKKGYSIANVPADMQIYFRPSIQPYMMSWLKYDPQQEIKKLKMPVLILQGTTDIQVGFTDARNLKKAQPHASLEMIAGMNHILKPAPADREENGKTYNDPNLPIKMELVREICLFINK